MSRCKGSNSRQQAHLLVGNENSSCTDLLWVRGLSFCLPLRHLRSARIYLGFSLPFINARAVPRSWRSLRLRRMFLYVILTGSHLIRWKLGRCIRPWGSLCGNSNIQSWIYYPSACREKLNGNGNKIIECLTLPLASKAFLVFLLKMVKN